MEEFAVARAVVGRLREWRPRVGDNALLESADVAVIGDRAGFLVLWTQHTHDQGTRQYGLLVALQEIVYGRAVGDSDVDRIFADLWLAVVEPHHSMHSRARTMFYELP